MENGPRKKSEPLLDRFMIVGCVIHVRALPCEVAPLPRF